MSNPHPVGKREKGVPNRWTSERLEEMRRVYEAAKNNPDDKLAVDRLRELMNLAMGMAAYFQPDFPLPGQPPPPKKKHASLAEYKFFLQFALEAASKLAPYQSPTFRAIVIAPPPAPQTKDGVRRVELRVFEGGRQVKVYAPVVDDPRQIEGEANAEEPTQAPAGAAEGEAGGGVDVVPGAPGSPEEDR